MGTKQLLTVQEAGEALRCGKSTVYGLMSSGKLRSVHVGRCRRIPVSALEELIASLEAEESGVT
jgi:excisionase family DNA binding protein